MKPWIIYAVLAAAFAGFTSVIAKLGLNGISGELGLAVRTVCVFALVLLFAAFVVPAREWAALSAGNLGWLGLSGVTTSLSWIFYYKALKQGEVSTIALIDKGSILVAVALAVFVLKEQVTWRTLAGGGLIVSGIVLLAKK